MNMPEIDSLPVLLISATNELEGSTIMQELICKDVTEVYKRPEQCQDRVWRLVNKYYTADVRVHVLPDDRQLDLDPSSVEAHIICIDDQEVCEAAVSAAERRVSLARGAWARCHVRVLLARAPAAALGAWAARERAELLAPRALDRDEGLARARDALHAHVWPNLSRTDTHRRATPETESAESSESADERQMALFAAALDALGAEERAPDAPRLERLERAERVVRAFCHALGLAPEQL